jgi:hypothetical protein
LDSDVVIKTGPMNQEQLGGLSVSMLEDVGKERASESTFYKVLKERKKLKHRREKNLKIATYRPLYLLMALTKYAVGI